MNPEPADLLYVALLIGLWWAKLTYALFRRNRYLTEALLREQASSIARQNAMQKQLLEAFLRGPKPTLRELVDDLETTFEAKP